MIATAVGDNGQRPVDFVKRAGVAADVDRVAAAAGLYERGARGAGVGALDIKDITARAEANIEILEVGIGGDAAHAETSDGGRRHGARVVDGIGSIVEVELVNAAALRATVDGQRRADAVQGAGVNRRRQAADVDRVVASAGVEHRSAGNRLHIDGIRAAIGVDPGAAGVGRGNGEGIAARAEEYIHLLERAIEDAVAIDQPDAGEPVVGEQSSGGDGLGCDIDIEGVAAALPVIADEAEYLVNVATGQRRRQAADINGVVARATGDHGIAIDTHDVDDVVVGATVDSVGAESDAHRVVAGITEDQIAGRATVDKVVVGTAVDLVTVALAEDGVVAGVAEDQIAAGAATDSIAAAIAMDDVVGTVAEDCIGIGAARDGVDIVAAMDGVEAGVA